MGGASRRYHCRHYTLDQTNRHVLQCISRSQKHFAWLDDDRRLKAKQSIKKGIDCILKCQIRVNGTLTGWCQQHDEVTFEAKPARTFELASICPQETASIIEYLMTSEVRSRDTDAAINAAATWLESVRIEGLRLEKIPAKEETFLRHKADFDIIVVSDKQAKPIWARHYEIGTDRPIFAGRDGIKKYNLSEIERERRTGTAWYGNWPGAVLAKHHAWTGKN